MLRLLGAGSRRAALVFAGLGAAGVGASSSNRSIYSHADGDHHVHEPTFGASATVRNNRKDPSRGDKQTAKKRDLSSLILVSGTSHTALTKEIAGLIEVPVSNATILRFSDGEVSIQMNDSLRGNDVVIVQSCASPVNDNIIELLLTVSCARRAGAKRVIAVIPYYGYKAHRRGSALSTKFQSRFLSSGAMDFAKMLQEMGVDRVISVDLQRPGQGQEACFFDTSVPLEVVLSTNLMIDHIAKNVKLADRLVVVAPNAETFKKARKFQAGLQQKLGRTVQLVSFFASDSGSGPTDTTTLELVGDIQNLKEADVVIVDDMVDTAGTLSDLSRLLQGAGAKNIYLAASHGLFTGNSMERIEQSPVKRVFVTNSLPLPEVGVVSSKVEQISIAPHLGHIILAEYFRALSTAKEEEFRDEWEGDHDDIE